MQQPLLPPGKGTSEEWSSYQHVERTGSVIPTASLDGDKVSVDEIRSAAAFSELYPSSLHAPLVGSPQPSDTAIGYHQDDYYSLLREPSIGRPVLDEVEIRELLIDHVGHRCCWGSRPARNFRIHAIEDCNVYVGTLDTFIEERQVVTENEPYLGGEVDGTKKGPAVGVWELDLRSEFPVLFTSDKESKIKIPHSEAIDKCAECGGRGKMVCSICNSDKEQGFYKENQMSQCPDCYGRGLIARKDGSDSICVKCKGKGMLPCPACESRGLVKCETCEGGGSILKRQFAIVKWKTLTAKKVNATSGAASVPEEVFERAKGVKLCNNQAYQCTPAYFADSYFLNKFSSEVINERIPAPAGSRLICERHTIMVVPVTRVTMTKRNQSFSFYIIGTSREVYLKDSYPSTFCWGLCSCFEW